MMIKEQQLRMKVLNLESDPLNLRDQTDFMNCIAKKKISSRLLEFTFFLIKLKEL